MRGFAQTQPPAQLDARAPAVQHPVRSSLSPRPDRPCTARKKTLALITARLLVSPLPEAQVSVRRRDAGLSGRPGHHRRVQPPVQPGSGRERQPVRRRRRQQPHPRGEPSSSLPMLSDRLSRHSKVACPSSKKGPLAAADAGHLIWPVVPLLTSYRDTSIIRA